MFPKTTRLVVSPPPTRAAKLVGARTRPPTRALSLDLHLAETRVLQRRLTRRDQVCACRYKVREENVFRRTLFSRGHACFAGEGHAGHRCFAKRIFLSTETEDEEEWLEWVDWRSTHRSSISLIYA